MHRFVVLNEDGAPLFTVAGSREIAEAWLLGYTHERRREAGICDSDEGWLQTLLDNGFYSIEEW